MIYGAGCGTTQLGGINVEALVANPAVLTCLANDIAYINIFSEQLHVKGSPDDLLIVLSGSGRSGNIIDAIKTASKLKMKSIAIIAFDGGEAKELADISIHAKTHDMQIAEDFQLIVGHLCMQYLRNPDGN